MMILTPERKQELERHGFQFDEWVDKLEAGSILTCGTDLKYRHTENFPGYDQAPNVAMLGRVLLGIRIGRTLLKQERVRYHDHNRKNYRAENLGLSSGHASAKELHLVNKEELPGYSVCLCGCGNKLDVALQGQRPHAYFPGHSPNDKIREKAKRAAMDIEEITPAPGDRPNPKTGTGRPARKPTPPTKEAADQLEDFRSIFDSVILALPWADFARHILPALREAIQDGKKGHG